MVMPTMVQMSYMNIKNEFGGFFHDVKSDDLFQEHS